MRHLTRRLRPLACCRCCRLRPARGERLRSFLVLVSLADLGVADHSSEVSLRLELAPLTLRALKSRARELGASLAAIDALDDAMDAKAAATDLVVASVSLSPRNHHDGGMICLPSELTAPWLQLPLNCCTVRVARLVVRAGKYIDYVSFEFSDGSSRSYGSATGGDECTLFAIDFEADEFITAVEGRGESKANRLSLSRSLSLSLSLSVRVSHPLYIFAT
jgi:hypothetical protein